jgi:hypothetical protein
MTQQTEFPTPPRKIIRWHPPAATETNAPECRAVWRDNVVRRQDFEVAHPDVIWLPRHGLDTPWVAYVPMLDGAFLEVSDATELGQLLDKLEIAVTCRDAKREQAA